MKSRVFARLKTTGLMQVGGDRPTTPVPKTRKVAKASIACHKFTCKCVLDEKCFSRCHPVCVHHVTRNQDARPYVTVIK